VINLLTRPVQAPFSDGVLVGDTLYLAGRIGIDPKTGKPPEDLEKEIRLLLDGVKETLAQAGMTMEDLVYVQVFCPDLSLYEEFNGIYRSYFSKNFPARAFVGSGPLLRGAILRCNRWPSSNSGPGHRSIAGTHPNHSCPFVSALGDCGIAFVCLCVAFRSGSP
jgi:enamine deaminase RidA (YjgF/YER057c/UK114 family)